MINITEAAASRLKEFTNPQEVVRIAVEGGGCAGFKYRFGLAPIEDTFRTTRKENVIGNLRESVKIAKKYYETEASGNINLKTVKSVAATGVNRISIGSITHSAPAIDFKIEI